MSNPANPLDKTPYTVLPPKFNPVISITKFHIAGIAVQVLGLNELPSDCTSITTLWLLHPRLQNAESMIPLGTLCINSYNATRGDRKEGIIGVTFDQRNHGARLVDEKSNGSWRDGNERHAQDMHSCYNGTAVDVSLLIDHLGSYIFENFPAGAKLPDLERNLVMGVSLGGHAGWQLLFAESRIEGAAVIIGCPDYTAVMTDRARLSKRKTYIQDNGASFHGSKDFPQALVDAIGVWDPRGILFGTSPVLTNPPVPLGPSEAARLMEILDERVKGKNLLVLSGAADKLVPYKFTEPFVKFLEEAIKAGGWWEEGALKLKNVAYEGVGHEVCGGMVEECVRWVNDIMKVEEGSSSPRESKI